MFQLLSIIIRIFLQNLDTNVTLLLFRRSLKYYIIYYYTKILILLIFHIINMKVTKQNVL